MSKYIKLEDAIEAYNQAVTLLVESEMEEFNLGDFTECSFNTTQIKLIARMIENLPTIEVSEDCISREYLLSKVYDMDNDNLVVDLKDIENAPSVVPIAEQPSMVGEWIEREDWNGDNYYDCSICSESFVFIDGTPSMNLYHYCPNCGSRMRGEHNDE